MLAWVDIETTGLDPEKEIILEVACVVTNDQLEEIGSISRVVPWGEGVTDTFRGNAHFVVQKMHDENGLWQACRAERGGPDPDRDVAREIAEWLKVSTFGAKLPMSGSTIAFDRSFIRLDMPELHACFSHRNIDVSVLRELAERWNPTVFAGRPGASGDPAHRALDDIRQSIEAMRYYRSTFLRVS